MHARKTISIFVMCVFCVSCAYGEENVSLWQKLRSKLSQQKEPAKPSVAKPADVKTSPMVPVSKSSGPDAKVSVGSSGSILDSEAPVKKSETARGIIVDKGVAAPDTETPLSGKEDESVARKARSKMTREELLADIKYDVESEEDILDYIPSLKKSKDADGNDVLTFNGVKIGDLNRADLEKLSVTVGQVSTRVRTDKIQRQMETIRQTQALAGGARSPTGMPRGAAPIASPPSLPPAPPVTTRPPQPPQTPQAPSAPRVPPSPVRR